MIPVHIPYKIRPEMNDPARQSVIYTFTPNDMVEYNHEYMLYRIAHSPCTYWTNFHFNKLNKIELIIITKEGTSKSITIQNRPNEWHNTFWPLPSIDTNDQSGYYFKIYERYEPGVINIIITMLGFIDLFPTSPVYQLVNSDQACQFIIIKEDPTSYEKNKKERGSIHCMTLEQKEINREDGVIIRPISQYQ